MTDKDNFLAADWPAPAGIHAGTTLRGGGCSQPPFASFNLGLHSGDQSSAVAANRKRLKQQLALPNEPTWLTQVHGNQVINARNPVRHEADASFTDKAGIVCAVLTADCLPVLFCDRAGSCWGAAHAGWRGLASGVIEATIARLPAQPSELLVWLGPAIGPRVFEVGQDVYDAFCERHPEDAAAFVAGRVGGKYLADIYYLARARLERAGVNAIYGGGLCTVSAPEWFYSYRRDGMTGRQASLVWKDAESYRDVP